MDIYSSNNYRKIWIHSNGPIPKDEQGRSYEIHHIDGNRSNNHIDNLQCISIQEHYDIHYSQKDYGACAKIVQRMNCSSELLSELSSLCQKERIENGTHHFLDREWVKKRTMDMIERGTHNFCGNNNPVYHKPNPFLGGEIQRKSNKRRVEDKTHNFFDPTKNSNTIKTTCPHCGKSGQLRVMKRWHFDNCKFKISTLQSSS